MLSALVTVTAQVAASPPVVVSVVPVMLQPAVPASLTWNVIAPLPEPPPLVNVRGTP